MKKSFIKIGQKTYKTKKDAIQHYRTILNSYDFEQSLNDSDIQDILDLLNYNCVKYTNEPETDVNIAYEDSILSPTRWYNDITETEDNSSEEYICNEGKFSNDETQTAIQEKYEMIARDAERQIILDNIETLNMQFACSETDTFTIETQINSLKERLNKMEKDMSEITVIDIKVARVQFNTKCFEVFFSDNTSWLMSYLMIINNQIFTSENKFNRACRSSVHNDIRAVKKEYFEKYSVKGAVKCQETGLLSKWEELVVDHRQPNTFSVIVDRFKEVNGIEPDKIEYTIDEQNNIVFKDSCLIEKFRKYHKEKANLRIVRKECNSSRTGLARIKRTSKDMTIKEISKKAPDLPRLF